MVNGNWAVDEAAQLRELAVQIQAVHTTAAGKAIDDIIANADSVEVLVEIVTRAVLHCWRTALDRDDPTLVNTPSNPP